MTEILISQRIFGFTPTQEDKKLYLAAIADAEEWFRAKYGPHEEDEHPEEIPDDYITRREAEQMSGTSSSTLKNWVAKMGITRYVAKGSPQIYYLRTDIERIINARKKFHTGGFMAKCVAKK